MKFRNVVYHNFQFRCIVLGANCQAQPPVTGLGNMWDRLRKFSPSHVMYTTLCILCVEPWDHTRSWNLTSKNHWITKNTGEANLDAKTNCLLNCTPGAGKLATYLRRRWGDSFFVRVAFTYEYWDTLLSEVYRERSSGPLLIQVKVA